MPPVLTGRHDIASARRALAAQFRSAGIDTPELDVRLLIGKALALDHTQLATASARALTSQEIAQITALAHRRLLGEPVARLVGAREFWGLRLHLSAETLVPRPETESVVEAALDALRPLPEDLRIADLGTGSGALLLALLHEKPNAYGVGTDRSLDALRSARRNAAVLGLAARAGFVACDFAAALSGPFDCIVSNPPYIPSRAIAALAPEVREHDPALALDGGNDGLDAYRAIAAQVPPLLRREGALILELGIGQDEAVRHIMAAQGLVGAAPSRLDLAGIPRALTLRLA